MVAGKDINQIVKKNDLIHIIILLAVTLGIGIYLIATTVLIAKDGVIYIEQAQNFSDDPIGIIKGDRPFGYPFLIFASHKLVTFGFDRLTTRLGCGTSASTWIYSAQGVTLLCRLLALVPLYFMGKFLVGSKRSFWAILILVILPYPARFGCDVLRDWPHILFLATGFLFLLLGAKHGKCWMFGVSGLAAGLGHVIRAECAQIVIYGISWLLISLFLTRPNISRLKAVCLILVLLIGFAIPVAPYMKARGIVLPPKLKNLIGYNTSWPACPEYPMQEKTPPRDGSAARQSGGLEQSGFECDTETCAASAISIDILNALVRLALEISDNLMYFFVPALVIGIYARFCRQSEATSIEKFFIPAFIILNVVMLILLYCKYGYISRRHAFPLIAFTIFYVTIGMQKLDNWLSSVSARIRSSTNQSRQWFFILLVIGGIICLPKLFSPIRIDKKVYRRAANWLKQNTAQKDLIAVPDIRISFYAERKGLGYEDNNPSEQVDYVVKIVKGEQEEPTSNQKLHEIKWFYFNERSKKQKLIIYKTM